MHSFLCSLLSSWANLIVAINRATNVENIKMDEILDQFLYEESRKRTLKMSIDPKFGN